MRIAIDISQIVYQTGVSRYTEQLVRHLLENNQDHNFFLYGGSLRQKKSLQTFVATIKQPKLKSYISSLSPTLVDFFWNRFQTLSPDRWLGKVDVFHASNWAIPPTQAKLVTTIHDLTFLKFPQSHTLKVVKAQTRHLARAKQKADMIICVSLATKLDLIEQGIPENKLIVIHEAPAKVFQPVSSQKKIQAVKDKYQLSRSFILSVGTQEPRKNLKRLIKAYSQIGLKKTDLVIVGKFGWGETTRPVPGVKLLGFIPDEDLAALYSLAKVFVYPSLYEGFGLPVLEALACGCPVITSNTSSLPEIGGDSPIYVNPRKTATIAQAIQTIIKLKPDKRRQLIINGFRQAKKFSWEKTAQKTLKVYQAVYDHRS